MSEVGQAAVAASQQLQNPWQLMVFLVVVGILFFCASGWAVYKMTARLFQSSDSARDHLIQAEKMYSENINKLREEHATDLKELVRENHQVMELWQKALEDNTKQTARQADAFERLTAAISLQAVQHRQ